MIAETFAIFYQNAHIDTSNNNKITNCSIIKNDDDILNYQFDENFIKNILFNFPNKNCHTDNDIPLKLWKKYLLI